MRVFRRVALLAVLCAAAAPAGAQMMYRGYDVGPDYGRMIEQQQELQRQRNFEQQRQEQAIVQSAMQDPRCQAFYRQHLAQGGGMSFPQFAYECARNGRFTPEGMNYANEVERRNRMREQQSLQELREAERRRGEAQGEYADRFQRNNQEFGNGLQGRGTYVDPGTGAPVVLQNLRPNTPTYDPRTGRTYVMDERGTYYVQGPGGWMPMQPGQ